MSGFFEIIKAVFFGIIQGITEWLPISSTGHMILWNELLPLNCTEAFWNTFLVVIQLGSILAVVVLYFHKLNPFSPRKNPQQKRATWDIWFKVVVAAVPAGVVGVLFDEKIERFNTPVVVAATLILYGVFFILIENRKRTPQTASVAQLSYKTAFLIGVFQILALIPGTSRSGATILGAILLGCSRVAASEFSFFLAIPMMFGASFVKLLKIGFSFSGLELGVLLTGSVVAFLVSVFAIRFLMSYIRKHDFKVFGWYRIALGILVLGYFLLFD